MRSAIIVRSQEVELVLLLQTPPQIRKVKDKVKKTHDFEAAAGKVGGGPVEHVETADSSLQVNM